MYKGTILQRTFRTFTIGFLLLAVASAAAAQKVWESKPYTEWTKEEIIEIIGDSPWARLVQPQASISEGLSNNGVTVRVRSALPIRQALVRLKQIENKYDKMKDKKKREFDEQMKGTLECPACRDNIVITFSPPISKLPLYYNIAPLRTLTLERLQGKVYLLSEKGDRRELVFFVPPKGSDGEATFFFPKLDNEQKNFITDSKKMIFIFDQTALVGTSATGSMPKRVEFDLEAMQYQDVAEKTETDN